MPKLSIIYTYRNDCADDVEYCRTGIDATVALSNVGRGIYRDDDDVDGVGNGGRDADVYLRDDDDADDDTDEPPDDDGAYDEYVLVPYPVRRVDGS